MVVTYDDNGVPKIMESTIPHEVKDFEDYLNELIVDMRETKSQHAVNYLKTANPADKTKFDVFNIGTANPQPIKLWIETIEKTFGVPLKYKMAEVDKGDVASSADISKANKILGYTPKMNIEEGIRRQVEIFKLMPEWYKTMKKV